MSDVKRKVEAGTPFGLLFPAEKRQYLREERAGLAYERFLRINALAYRTCPRCGHSVSMHFDSKVNRTVCSRCNSTFEGRVKGGEELTPTEVVRKRRADKAFLDRRREVDEWVFFDRSQDLAAELEDLRIQVMSASRFDQTHRAEPKPRVRKDAFEQFLRRLTER